MPPRLSWGVLSRSSISPARDSSKRPHDSPKDDADVPLKAEALNAELAKAGVDTTSEQKNVTAWLGLRNDAAHGRYDAHNEAQVRLMLEGSDSSCPACPPGSWDCQ